ncbi:hypothetical protein [Psychrobacter sp. MES7-P7E]|nr:hypothetical protein [Psychrobacter sp. MES7-P7E]
MDNFIPAITLVQAEPYLLGFVAGVVTHKFYLMNKWRFADKTKQAGK